jgi:hypothetical protein
MKKPVKLSAPAIEQLASQYKGYESAIKSAKTMQDVIREELLAQVEHYGAAAPKADKTFRLESASFIVDVPRSRNRSPSTMPRSFACAAWCQRAS